MTIHQPSAMVFDMLDDLLLLETGRTVFAGSIKDARTHFESLGYSNPESINPADYYLNLVQNKPMQCTEETPVTWSELFKQSQFQGQFDKVMEEALSFNVKKPASELPSFLTRFGIMLRYFGFYYIRERGYFVFRMAALIVIAIFTGTLWLNLQPTTENIADYSSAVFFISLCGMLLVISATALYAKDRYEAVDRVSNGVFSPGIFVSAQFMVSAAYNFVVAVVYISIFHWLSNLDPNGQSYLYDIFINWTFLMLMEVTLLVFLELLKNDFLACTSAMVYIGSNMAFAGFFRPVAEMPVWISWLSWIVSLRVSYHF